MQTRMKQSDRFSRSSIDRRNVRAFVAVAEYAAVSKIIESRITAVFSAYDVIDLMSESRQAFRVETIFTTKLGAKRDPAPYGVRLLRMHALASVQRAPLRRAVCARVEKSGPIRFAHPEKAGFLFLA